MTPAARLQAAIDVLDEIIVAARDEGPAADTLIARYFQQRRYAGSKDRRAVRDLVYRAIRRSGDRPDSGREAVIGLTQDDPDLAALFDGSRHGPEPIHGGEVGAPVAPLPAWIIPRLSPVIGAEERGALLERAPLDIRVNRLKADPASIIARIPEAEAIDGLPDALRLPEGWAVEQSPLWQDGLIEVQDAGSQMIVALCDARPGMSVIDLCAGAGGKTLALAAAMRGQGRLIAADISRPRLFRLPDRAARAAADRIELLLLDGGREDEALAPHGESADVVLVDAPCSGSGTWRRNPEARWRLTPARLERIVEQQRVILDRAATLVRPGGRLVYAVCALTREEGAAQIEAFLARAPGWQPLVPDFPPGRPDGPGRLLSPAVDGTDGFFMAALERAKERHYGP